MSKTAEDLLSLPREEKMKLAEEMLKQGKSYEEIEKELGLSRRDIAEVKRRLEEERRRRLRETIDVTLKAMEMLDDGYRPVEVMSALGLDVETMKSILASYRELNELARPEATAAEYFVAIAKLFGARIRDVCPSYVPEHGICTEYSLYDIDPDFKRSYPSLFKGYGGRTRFHVGNHPEICTMCRRGVRRGE
ncbi:MAG: hypothetical protein QXK94_10570 [Candidatus Jordarchaeales archaeon]